MQHRQKAQVFRQVFQQVQRIFFSSLTYVTKCFQWYIWQTKREHIKKFTVRVYILLVGKFTSYELGSLVLNINLPALYQMIKPRDCIWSFLYLCVCDLFYILKPFFIKKTKIFRALFGKWNFTEYGGKGYSIHQAQMQTAFLFPMFCFASSLE